MSEVRRAEAPGEAQGQRGPPETETAEAAVLEEILREPSLRRRLARSLARVILEEEAREERVRCLREI